MLAEKRTATNIGIAAGIGLEVVAIALVVSGRPLLSLLALPVLLASAVFFAWGCWSYAAGKGYPGVLGLLGVFFGFIGLLIMIVLPDKCRDGRAPTPQPAHAADRYAAPSPSHTYGAHPVARYSAFVGTGTDMNAGGTRKPPMGGDGAAGWEEETSLFAVPPIAASAIAMAPATVAPAAVEVGDEPRTMRSPTPVPNHWSVQASA